MTTFPSDFLGVDVKVEVGVKGDAQNFRVLLKRDWFIVDQDLRVNLGLTSLVRGKVSDGALKRRNHQSLCRCPVANPVDV